MGVLISTVIDSCNQRRVKERLKLGSLIITGNLNGHQRLSESIPRAQEEPGERATPTTKQ